jgi:hypothetical protein
MAVPIAAEPAFEAKKPAFLFRQTNVVGWRDISPDGKRFVMMKEAGLGAAEGLRKISIVANWFEKLRQRVPEI